MIELLSKIQKELDLLSFQSVDEYERLKNLTKINTLNWVMDQLKETQEYNGLDMYNKLQQAITLELECIHKVTELNYVERVHKLQVIEGIYKRFEMLNSVAKQRREE